VNAFAVWAPAARSVEVALARGRSPLSASANGWWTGEAEAGPGDDYSFVLDGADPLPDPRSPFQPGGVHGPSRLVDHAAFPWTDAGWRPPPLSSAIIYELHVGTFTSDGTFASAAKRLPHLVDLGVTHVELMPVAEFPGTRGWGYDGVDLFAPHHAYGGPDGLKALVDACHGHGLAVVLDVVYNHLGPAGNYLPRFGPYFTGRHQTPWGEAVNLDGPGSDEVRRFFCDNALMWLRDYHVDGLRLDAVHAFLDSSALPFLEQLAEEVAALEAELGRELVLVAESDRNDPRLVRPREAGGLGMDAQWSDDFHHALHAFLTGERHGYYSDYGPLADVAKALRDAFVVDGRHSRYRNRRHGRPATGLSGHRFLGYLQNHDQVGNRARGERSAHLLSPGRLRVAAALVLASPFVPLLFQGEEWGARTPFLYFTDHQDPVLARAVSEGRRREFAAFGWRAEDVPDPQDRRTFAASKLDWSEPGRSPHRELLDWHRRLVALRRRTPALLDGRREAVRADFDEDRGWLAFERGPVTVACNFAAETQRVPLARRHDGVLLFSGPGEPARDGGALRLPSDTVAILSTGAAW
jgi:maltooligosyltrehalose trehalohydrolase